METPRARDDLVIAVLRRRPHQQRLDDGALADGREYVADIRGLAAVPHVGPADRQPVLRYEHKGHCSCSFDGYRTPAGVRRWWVILARMGRAAARSRRRRRRGPRRARRGAEASRPRGWTRRGGSTQTHPPGGTAPPSRDRPPSPARTEAQNEKTR